MTIFRLKQQRCFYEFFYISSIHGFVNFVQQDNTNILALQPIVSIVLRHIGLFLTNMVVSAMSGTLDNQIMFGTLTVVVRVLGVLQENTRTLWAPKIAQFVLLRSLLSLQNQNAQHAQLANLGTVQASRHALTVL